MEKSDIGGCEGSITLGIGQHFFKEYYLVLSIRKGHVEVLDVYGVYPLEKVSSVLEERGHAPGTEVRDIRAGWFGDGIEVANSKTNSWEIERERVRVSNRGVWVGLT